MSLSRPQAQSAISPAASSDFAYRVQYVVTIALAFSAIIMMVIYLVLALQWHNQPFLGVLTSNTLMVNRASPVVDAQWSGRAAGIRDFASATDPASPTTVRSGSPLSRSTRPRRTTSWSSTRKTEITAPD